MNKFKKAICFSFFATAAIGMATGVCVLGVNSPASNISTATYSEPTITNPVLQDYFSIENAQNSTYFFSNTLSASRPLTFKFNTSVDVQKYIPSEGDTIYYNGNKNSDNFVTAETSPTISNHVFKYIPNPASPNTYNYFDISLPSITVDGVSVTVVGDNTLDKLVLQSPQQVLFPAEDEMQAIYPDTFNMKVVYDPTNDAFNDLGPNQVGAKIDEAKVSSTKSGLQVTPATLTLNKTGVLAINLPFSIHTVTATKSTTTNGFEEIESEGYPINDAITQQVLFLNNGDYYENQSMQNETPKFSYDSNILNRTNVSLSESATHQYNYFYNYQSSSLPWIKYDPKRFRFTITKSLNNNSQSERLLYDPQTKSISIQDENGQAFDSTQILNDIVLDSSEMVTLYFNDVGEYNIGYDILYTQSEAESNNFNVYTIDRSIKNQKYQKVYVFGSQIQFSNYSTGSTFSEFKTIVDHKFDTSSADITYNFKDELSSIGDLFGTDSEKAATALNTITEKLKEPVSTNQAPIKLSYYFTSPSIVVYTKVNETWTKSANTYTQTSTFSNADEYLIAAKYSFANHTTTEGSEDDEAKFYQLFHFRLENQTPEVIVKAGDNLQDAQDQELQLGSNAYTNKPCVVITDPKFKNTYNSSVVFELEREDFTGGASDPRQAIQKDNSGKWNFDENGNVVIEEQGKYTIYITYRTQTQQQKPIIRKFNIDREDIQDIQAYAVETDLNQRDHIVTPGIDTLTNQSFILTWQNQKRSGALTNAYYRHFPLSANTLYSDPEQINNIVNMFLGNGLNALATNKTLDMSSDDNAAWPQYYNPVDALNTSNQIVQSSFVKRAAGLYVFQIFDTAGNSKVKIVMLDDSNPMFVLRTSTGYSLFTSNYHTLSTDASIVWSKNKAIFVDGWNNISSSWNEEQTNTLFKNERGEKDEKLFNAFKDFFSSENTISVSNLQNSSFNGTYFNVPIVFETANEVKNYLYAYKDRSSELTTMIASDETEKDIRFSYSVHYTQSSSGAITFYFSTNPSSQTSPIYLKVLPNGETEQVESTIVHTSDDRTEIQIENLKVQDAAIWLRTTNGRKEYFYAKDDQEATLTSVENSATKVSYNQTDFAKVDFVDMEGTYIFMIRDTSNTKGRNLDRLQQFLNFSSSYQYIRVTGDTSNTHIYAKSADDQEIPLTEAVYSDIGITEDENSFKTSYNLPSSYDKLYVSFLPTIETPNGRSQVDKVKLEFYAFVTSNDAALVPESDAKIFSDDVRVNYYTTLSSTPATQILYDFSKDGESTDVIERELNPGADQKTRPGKYVLTRTYVTNSSGEELVNYFVNPFDYQQRTISANEDRFNVIEKEAQTYSYEKRSYTYTVNGQKIKFDISQFDKILKIDYQTAQISSTEPDFNGHALSVNNKTVKIDVSADGSQQDTNGTVYCTRTITNNGKTVYLTFRTNIESYALSSLISKANDEEDGYVSSTVNTSARVNPVGGEMLVNMFDGQTTVVSVTFPYFDGLLRANENFWTQENTTGLDGFSEVELSQVLTTNKLPVAIYIPSEKYTLSNKRSLSGNNLLSFESFENKDLNYYNTETYASSSIIVPYQLHAEISLTTANNTSIVYTSYKYNETDLTEASENGFLKFKNAQTQEEISSFNTPGTYVVTITQGYNLQGGTEGSFKKSYRFKFIVEEPTPSFDITANGAPLRGLPSSSNLVYTNSNTVNVRWTDFNSRFMSDIDKSYITLQAHNADNTRMWSHVLSVASGSVEVVNNDEARPIPVGAFSYQISGVTNILGINLETLGLFSQNRRISITMRYQGSENATTTKSVSVDKRAPSENVERMVSSLKSLFPSQTAFNVRRYLDINGSEVTLDEAAYNVSQNVGYFEKYYFTVEKSFFQNLVSYVRNVRLSPIYQGETYDVFFKELKSDWTETEFGDFVEAQYEFSNLQAPSGDLEGKFFEVVERDLAGNLAIYVVYVPSEDAGQTKDGVLTNNDENEAKQGIFLLDSTTKQASDQAILSGKLSMFGSTNTRISNINFLGDSWTRFSIGNRAYMFTPALSETQVLDLSTNQPVDLRNLLQGLSGTIQIQIADRRQNLASITPAFKTMRLVLRDGTRFEASFANGSIEELALTNVNTSTFYPVKIEITINAIPFTIESNPNDIANLTNASYDYILAWNNNENAVVSLQNSIFTISLGQRDNGTKIKYKIFDCFGNVLSTSHIVGSEIIADPVTSTGNLYQSLEEYERENKMFYISPTNISYKFYSSLYSYDISSPDIEKTDIDKWASPSLTSNNITTLTFKAPEGTKVYNTRFVLKLYDLEDEGKTEVADTIYLHLYQMLPALRTGSETFESSMFFRDPNNRNITSDIFQTNSNAQRVSIDGTDYLITAQGVTFASRIRLFYSTPDNLPFPVAVSVYKSDGSLGSGFANVASGSDFSESGIYFFLVKYTSPVLDKEYRLYQVEIMDFNDEFYTVTSNGARVERASVPYYDEYEDHSDYYIVNSSGAIVVVPNVYQKVVVFLESTTTLDGIETRKYEVTNLKDEDGNMRDDMTGLQPFDTHVYVTTIPSTNTPVKEAYFTFDGIEQTSLLNLSTNSLTAQIPEDQGITSLKIYFLKYNGIPANENIITIQKDGVSFPVETKDAGDNKYYVELSRTGTYTITLSDTSKNVQTFGRDKVLNLTLLNDVAFSMTFTNADGVQQTTDPIQKGVFNNQVLLTLLNKETYYTTTSTGSGEQLIKSVKRNGIDYSQYVFDRNNGTILFNEPGYYNIVFSATSSALNLPLRETTYSFTIVSPDESRYAFEFAQFNNYYIESISKGTQGDITKDANQAVPEALKNKFPTTNVGGQEYLRAFATSFGDTNDSALASILGEGKYTVTIATAQNLNRDDYSKTTKFSFNFWINSKRVPIDISANEGESTSKNITVSFNAERVFEAVGECNITIGANVYHLSGDTIQGLGTVTQNISSSGTYFITVHSMSGSLLYSYKIIKTEPLNAWAIAAIVIAGVVLIAVAVVIFLLRKRIKVK